MGCEHKGHDTIIVGGSWWGVNTHGTVVAFTMEGGRSGDPVGKHPLSLFSLAALKMAASLSHLSCVTALSNGWGAGQDGQFPVLLNTACMCYVCACWGGFRFPVGLSVLKEPG